MPEINTNEMKLFGKNMYENRIKCIEKNPSLH